MTTLRTPPQSFVAGELSGRMFGRPDDPKYAHGAARLQNMYVEPSGAARRRPGSQHVRRTRTETFDLLPKRVVTFALGNGNGVCLELGYRNEFPATSSVYGYLRFHAEGATVLHSAAWSASKAYPVGEYATVAGLLYRCRQAHTNQLPPATAFWEPREYVVNQTFSTAAVNVTTDQITFGAPHGLAQNDPIEFTNDTGGAPVSWEFAPGEIRNLVTGFAVVVSPTVLQVALTPGGPAINLSGTGTGTHRVHRSYVAGDLVSRTGVIYYCRRTRPINGSGVGIQPGGGDEAYWYVEPADGPLELPTTLAIPLAEFWSLTHSQNGNRMSFAAPSVAVGELVRIDAQTWTWDAAALVPTVPAPSGVAAVATKRGATIAIFSIALGSPALVQTVAEHNLVPGLDYVYCEGTGNGSIDNKFFAVAKGTSAFSLYLVNVDTGLVVGTVLASSTGTLRRTQLHSDVSNSYVVTAISAEDRESPASAAVSVTNNLFATGALNTITWAAVPGAVRYRVYKRTNAGIFGFIGQASTTSFEDRNIAAQLDLNPPILDSSLMAGAGTFPRAVGHHEGRRWFGGSVRDPQDVWATRTNTDSDLSYSIPLKATDRIRQQLKSRVACTIRHLVPIGGSLVALTDTTEFRIAPIGTEALTPESFSAQAHSYVGASGAQPAVAQNILVFAAASGGHVFQLGYRDDVGGLVASDLCERATHLFDGLEIAQMAVQQTPVPIVWCVSSNGRLLGLTFVPSQAVWAWHWHDTDGVVESLTVVSEGGVDRVYLSVRRTIDGVVSRYIERLATFAPVPWAESWCVDAGLRYSGPPATLISGLQHLEGKTVAVFADGTVQPTRVVTGGQITLDRPAAQVLVGLPFTSRVQTLPAMFAIEAYSSGRPKNVSQVWVRLEASGPFLVGIQTDDLMPAGDVPAGGSYTGLVQVRVPQEWTMDGQLFVEQSDPVPLTLVSLTAEMAVGG